MTVELELCEILLPNSRLTFSGDFLVFFPPNPLSLSNPPPYILNKLFFPYKWRGTGCVQHTHIRKLIESSRRELLTGF